MSLVVITGAEVFSESDPEHPVAVIKRVGGGKYLTQLLVSDKDGEKVEADDYESAVVQADAHATELDNTPATSKEKLALARTIKDQAAQIADLEAIIADLQANPMQVVATSKPVSVGVRG